ncbi:MAG: glycosyltransferase family 4 protein [Methyloprofundus sp.]|nr:glycosyltransferase family 4 protein [Methyloprofundus sp.]
MKNNNWAMLCLSPAKGGLEMLAVDSVKNIAQFGYAIALEKSWVAESLSNLTDRNIYLSAKLGIRYLPYFTALKIAQWIKGNNISLLHIHWAKDLPLAALIKKILIAKHYKLQLVVSRHMSLPHPKKSLYHRWIYSSVDAYISVCDFVHEQAKSNLPISTDKLYKIYPGVDAAEQSNHLPFVIDSKKNNIIVLGRLEPVKGQHLMLQALAHLSKPNIHCYFVGQAMGESYLTELKALASSLGVTSNVTFCNFIPQPAQYLAHFDALILTTRCETFGLVLIEAMRAGILAIGSRAGGVTEIIEHQKTGLLFATENASALAEQLEWFIAHPSEINTIALEGKKRAEQLFDKTANYRLLENTLEKL